MATANYEDGEIVWVKLSNSWWPGEVCDESILPEGALTSLKKSPIAVVKFFNEDSFEFVRNFNCIYKYNCTKKNEFIRKGLELYRSNNKFAEKFPADVQIAETKTGGNKDILDSEEFAPNTLSNRRSATKTMVKMIFGENTPGKNSNENKNKKNIPIKLGFLKGTSTVTIKNLTQSHEKLSPQIINTDLTCKPTTTTTSGLYKCHLCSFTSLRQNVIIIHSKTHKKLSMNTSLEQSTSEKCSINKSISPSVIIIDDDSEGESRMPKIDLVTTNKSSLDVQTSRNKSTIFPINEQLTTLSSANEILNRPVRQPPKKQLSQRLQMQSIETEKRKEISSIIAEWSDTEDLETNANELSTTNVTKNIECLTKSEINSDSTMLPQPKIRNIPKKDRRAIVFDDFNSKDLTSSSNSSSSNENIKEFEEKCTTEDNVCNSDLDKAASALKNLTENTKHNSEKMEKEASFVDKDCIENFVDNRNETLESDEVTENAKSKKISNSPDMDKDNTKILENIENYYDEIDETTEKFDKILKDTELKKSTSKSKRARTSEVNKLLDKNNSNQEIEETTRKSMRRSNKINLETSDNTNEVEFPVESIEVVSNEQNPNKTSIDSKNLLDHANCKSKEYNSNTLNKKFVSNDGSREKIKSNELNINIESTKNEKDHEKSVNYKMTSSSLDETFKFNKQEKKTTSIVEGVIDIKYKKAEKALDVETEVKLAKDLPVPENSLSKFEKILKVKINKSSSMKHKTKIEGDALICKKSDIGKFLIDDNSAQNKNDTQLDINESKKGLVETMTSENLVDAKQAKYSKRIKNISRSSGSADKRECKEARENSPIEIKSNIKIISNDLTFQHNKSPKIVEIVPLKNEKPSKSADGYEVEQTLSARTLRNRGKYSKLVVEIIEDEIESPAMSPLRKSPIRIKSPIDKIKKQSPLTKTDKSRGISPIKDSDQVKKLSSNSIEKSSTKSTKTVIKHNENKNFSEDKLKIKREIKETKTNTDNPDTINDLASKNMRNPILLLSERNNKKETHKSESNGEMTEILKMDELNSSKIADTDLDLNKSSTQLEMNDTVNKDNSLSIESNKVSEDKKGPTNAVSIEIKKRKTKVVRQSFDQSIGDKRSSTIVCDNLKTNMENKNENAVKEDTDIPDKISPEYVETNADKQMILTSKSTSDSSTTQTICESENVIIRNDKHCNRKDSIKVKSIEKDIIPKDAVKPLDKKTKEKSKVKDKEDKDICTTKKVSTINNDCSAELHIVEIPDKLENNLNFSENPPESAVFDFRDEDEDFEVLTTIAELKKKYSPEKSKTSEELITTLNKTESKTVGEEKCLPEKLDSIKIHQSENAGGKIKEKNKRIFKSRNRSNESSTSSSTTIASLITSHELMSSSQQNKASLKDFELVKTSPDNKILEAHDEDCFTIKRRRSHIKIIPRKFDNKPSTSNNSEVKNIDSNKEYIQTEILPDKSLNDVKVLEINTNQVVFPTVEETKNQLKSPAKSSETTADIRSFRRTKNLKVPKANQEQNTKDLLQTDKNKFTDDKTDSDIVKAVDQIVSLQKSPSVTVSINNSNNQCKIFEKFAIEVKTDVTLGDQISDILYKAPEVTTKKRKQTIEDEIVSTTSQKTDSTKTSEPLTDSNQPARKISKISRKSEDTSNILYQTNEEILKTTTPNKSEQFNDYAESIETPAGQLLPANNLQDNIKLMDQANELSTTVNSQETIQQQISQLNQNDQLSKKHRSRPKKSIDSPPRQPTSTQSNFPSQTPAEQYGYDSKGNRLVIIKYGNGSKPIINEKLIIKQQVQPALSPAINIINSDINIALDNSPTLSAGDITTNQIIITSKGNVVNQSPSYTTTRTNSPATIQENLSQKTIKQQVQKIDNKSTPRQQQSQFNRPRKRKTEQTVTSPPPLTSISSNESNAAKQQKFINTITKSLTNTLNTSSTSSAPHSVPEEEIQSRIMAVPACHFNLPGNAYYLCSHDNDGNYMPIDNQELYLDPETNQLVPAAVIQQKQQEAVGQNIILTNENDVVCVEVNDQQQQQEQDQQQQQEQQPQHQQQQLQQENNDISNLLTQQQVVINIDGQQLILDHQDFMALAASNGETQLVTADGQTFIISPEFLQALGICGSSDSVQQQLLQTENVETLDNSTLIGDVLQIESTDDALLQHNTQAETNATNAILTQPPIMSTLETPSTSNKKKLNKNKQLTQGNDEVLRPQNLDECIAFIATQSSNVPSSLELPITVTNPNIAPKLSSNLYNPKALVAPTDSQISPNAQLQFTSDQELNELFITSNTCDVQQKIVIDESKADDQVEGHDMNEYSNQSSVISGINFDDPR